MNQTSHSDNDAPKFAWAYGGIDGLLTDGKMHVARARYKWQSGDPIEVELLAAIDAGEVLDAYGLDCERLYVSQRASWLRHPSAIHAGDLADSGTGDAVSDRAAVMAVVSVLRRKAAIVSGATRGIRSDLKDLEVDDAGMVKMPSVSARIGAVSMAVMAEILYRAGHDGKWKWLASDGSRREQRMVDREIRPAWEQFLRAEIEEYHKWNWSGIEPLSRFLKERYPNHQIDWSAAIKAVNSGMDELPPLP